MERRLHCLSAQLARASSATRAASTDGGCHHASNASPPSCQAIATASSGPEQLPLSDSQVRQFAADVRRMDTHTHSAAVAIQFVMMAVAAAAATAGLPCFTSHRAAD